MKRSEENSNHLTLAKLKLIKLQITNQITMKYNQQYCLAWQHFLSQFHLKQTHSLNQLITLMDRVRQHQSPISNLLQIAHYHLKEITHCDLNNHLNLDNHTDFSIIHTKLNTLFTQLKQANDSNHPQQIEQQMTVTLLTTPLKSPLYQLYLTSNTLPKPLKHWMLALIKHTWSQLIRDTIENINHTWQNQIWHPYENIIAHKNNRHSKYQQRINLAEFTGLFNPKGTLLSFFSQTLAPYINQQSRFFSMPISHNVLKQFQKIQSISRDFFNPITHHLSVCLSLTPTALDPTSKSIRIQMDDNGFVYAHGPQFPHRFCWPPSSTTPFLKITVSDFTGHQYERLYKGPWALFDLLKSNHLKKIRAHQFKIKFIYKHHTAIFDIHSTTSFNTLTLKTLHHLNLSRTLQKPTGAPS